MPGGEDAPALVGLPRSAGQVRRDWQYLKLDDIDDFYGELLANGLTPSTEPRKDRSGRREFVLLDPDGNRLAFFAK